MTMTQMMTKTKAIVVVRELVMALVLMVLVEGVLLVVVAVSALPHRPRPSTLS